MGVDGGVGEAALISAAIAAAGSGVQMHETAKTQHRQDSAAAQAIIQQANLNREAGSKVRNNITELQKSNPAEAQAQQVQAYTDAIKRAAPGASQVLNPVGNASGRYAEDVSTAKNALATDAATKATNMAQIDAPLIQRQQEAQRAASTATDIGLVGQKSKAQAFLDQLKIQSQRNNPWVMAGGDLLKAAGAAYGSNAAWGAGTGTGAGIQAGNGLSKGLMVVA